MQCSVKPGAAALTLMVACLAAAAPAADAGGMMEMFGPSQANPHCQCAVTTRIYCDQGQPAKPCLTKVCVNEAHCTFMVGMLRDLRHVTNICTDESKCQVCVLNQCKVF